MINNQKQFNKISVYKIIRSAYDIIRDVFLNYINMKGEIPQYITNVSNILNWIKYSQIISTYKFG